MMLLEWIKDLLFPRKCMLCQGLLAAGENDLCRSCMTQTPESGRSGGDLPELDEICVVWRYEGAVRESLLRFKFHNRPGYAAGYGRMLAMALLRRGMEPQAITWVPVSPQRLRKRGYDQAELLARAVGQELGWPVIPTLEKIWDNGPQSGLSDARQRRENVRDAYRLRPNAALPKQILLVDDILTTGATAGECAGLLHRAGIEKITLGVVAAGELRYDSAGTAGGDDDME